VAKVYQPLVIAGVRYSVMKLSLSARGPRFLLRDDQGRIFGVWPGANSIYRADLLTPARSQPNPLGGVQLCEGDGRLVLLDH
jgi:hypothetical protein